VELAPDVVGEDPAEDDDELPHADKNRGTADIATIVATT